MLNLLLVLSVIAALAWAFVALARHFGTKEVSFWAALGIHGFARLSARFLSPLVPDTDMTPRFGIGLAIYFIVVTAGLIWVAGVRPVTAMGLGAIVSLAAILIPLIFIWTGVV